MDIYTVIVIILAAVAIIGLLSFGLILKYLDRRFEKRTKVASPMQAREEKQMQGQVPPEQQPPQQ